MHSKYELIQQIGAGGMGEVFLGYVHGENEFRRPVAIKRVRRERVDDGEAVTRFIREAHIGAKLDHPNIVSVFDLHRTKDGDLHMVMEYVPGFSLHEMARATRLPIPAAVHVIGQVLEGLKFAHDRGIIHCDIKPHNILIATDTGAVKIADFGLACLLSCASQRRGDEICGTLPYCAPEQLTDGEVDQQADLFSVGVMFYLLLTGRLPFAPSDNVGQAMAKILYAPIQPAYELNPHVPPELDLVVMGLLARDPEERYRRAEHVMEALSKVVGSKDALMAMLAGLERPKLPPGSSMDGAEGGQGEERAKAPASAQRITLAMQAKLAKDVAALESTKEVPAPANHAGSTGRPARAARRRWSERAVIGDLVLVLAILMLLGGHYLPLGQKSDTTAAERGHLGKPASPMSLSEVPLEDRWPFQ